MCLIVDSKYPSQPDGSIRWKLMRLHSDGTVGGMNYNLQGWDARDGDTDHDHHAVGGVRSHKNDTAGEYSNPSRDGIHVCPDEQSFDVILDWYQLGAWKCKFAKVKLECRGFMAGGWAEGRSTESRTPNETWREVTILEITEVSNRRS